MRGSMEAFTLLRAEGLECTLRGRKVRHGISLPVKPGDFLGVVGPNGAGKSTLLKSLAGILRPSAGSVFLEGRDVQEIPEKERARTLAYVSQNPQVGFGFRVADVVAMGRYPYRGRFSSLTAADREAMRAAMEHTGVAEFAERPITQLSGGERQRVFLARALAQQPKILLLDEPIASLDVRYQLDILELVRSLNESRGLTVVMAIHDLTWALRFCRTVAAMKEGRLAACGPAASTLTEALIAEVFHVSARVTGIDGEPARVDIVR